jgi:hypothetical protein
MGYYVRLEESTAVLPKKHQAEAYRRMCALNDNDERKQGGSWSDGQEEKWFSWMDPNYPDTCADAKAILADLGFWFDENEDGDLLFTDYDSKAGQEDLFIFTIGNLMTGYMVWSGEDGDKWRWEFGPDGVKELFPRPVEWVGVKG